MNINKTAYTALVAFCAAITTLVISHALSGGRAGATEPPRAAPISREELARHNSRDSCWKAIDGKVYDITTYIPQHPSPEAVLLAWCGRDASAGWHNKRPGISHSGAALKLLAGYLIGDLESISTPTPPPVAAPTPASQPDGRLLLGLAPGTYLDGRYRGSFLDRGEMQVAVQFDLRDGRLMALEYRHLAYGGIDYLALAEDAPLSPVTRQYRQVADYLNGKLLHHIFDLYHPEQMVADTDGYTGASLRTSKVISAIRDGLNRGVYQWPRE
ncbi:cytochrome b5 domain-containing protein [Zobellella sp. DQSA1]|uniref:cytochrome b5 domain-containing protein n=1 Tax=Zobellella sp. DQSA1 TaxID=3342386 RepID=UPI0035C164BD